MELELVILSNLVPFIIIGGSSSPVELCLGTQVLYLYLPSS